MFIGTVLVVVISLILFGLVRSTERILDIRQKQRDQGNNTQVYL